MAEDSEFKYQHSDIHKMVNIELPHIEVYLKMPEYGVHLRHLVTIKTPPLCILCQLNGTQ